MTRLGQKLGGILLSEERGGLRIPLGDRWPRALQTRSETEQETGGPPRTMDVAGPWAGADWSLVPVELRHGGADREVRARATMVEAASWLAGDVETAVAVARRHLAEGAELEAIEAVVGKVRGQVVAARFDVVAVRWGIGGRDMAGLAEALDRLRLLLHRAAPLDARGRRLWDRRRAAVAVGEAGEEVLRARAAAARAAAAFGVEVEPPPDLDAEWWNELRSLADSIVDAGAALQVAAGPARRGPAGRPGAEVALGTATAELVRLSAVAKQLGDVNG